MAISGVNEAQDLYRLFSIQGKNLVVSKPMLNSQLDEAIVKLIDQGHYKFVAGKQNMSATEALDIMRGAKKMAAKDINPNGLDMIG